MVKMSLVVQFGHPGYEKPPPELPPFVLVSVQVHVP